MVKAARNHLERLFPGVTGADLKDQPLPGGSQRFIDKLDDDSKDMAALVAAFQRAHLPGVGAHSLPGDLDEITLAAVLTHAVESGTDISSFMGSKAEQTADKDEEPLPGTKKAVLSPKQATEAAQWYLQGNRGKELLPLVPHIAKALGLGDRVTIDADFIDAIAKFQKQHSPDGNNGVDGKIGPATLALLKSKLGIEPEKKADPSGKAGLDAKNVWPKDKAPNKRYDHYAALLKQAGYSLDTANPKRPIVIGLRGLRQGARQTHRTKAVRDYDDTFVMLWKDKDGKKKIFEFKGATHPYQKGPNKYGGVAMIKGDMQYDVSTIGNHSYYGYKAPHVKYDNGKTTTGDVPAYRQKDYDGFYSSKGEDKQTPADAILFHPGYDTKRRTKNSKFSSIGCQTANGKDIERMTSIAFSGAEGGSKKGFDYILMNGDSAVKAADAAAKLRGQQEKAPEGTVRRHGHGDVDAKKALPTADRMLRSSTSSARPSADVVTAMRSAMGIDVGAVQLHFDGAAANAANVLNAEAFSVGNHVYFGTGRYQPKSADGLELLFHELAHTAQPSTGGVGAPGTGLRLGSATSVYEQAADHAARLAMASLTAPTTHAGPVKAATGGSTLRRRTRKKDADKDNDQAAPKKKTKAQTLTDKVLTAVTMTESNGVAVESRLNTSAGTKASYKSKVQATAIWAVDHIAKHPAIMKKFGITKEALAKGTARLQAGGRVYDRVMRSWGTADEFVKANQARLKAAGFTKTDVEAMMAFRDFKRSAARSTEKDAIAKGKKAGLDATSAKTYRRRARAGRPIWGEDAAAWEREALNRGGDGLGEKVQKAVEHDGGMTLGRAVIGAHVEAYLKRNPNASASAVVRYVARKHNPHAGSPYITKTWNHYKKLYGNR